MKKKIKIFILGFGIIFYCLSFSVSAQVDCTSACQSLGYTGTALSNCIDECQKENEAASTSSSDTTTTTFPNPIGFKTVSELLNAILNNLMGIIVIISVIFIVIGGIMYMTSAGNETMVTRAKKTWTGAVVGLAIALAAPTFLKEIQNILGGGGTGGSAENWVSNALTIQQIAANVLNFLLSVIGIIAMIALVIGGGMYLTAYGDERKIDTGKKIITYAIIGIVVALASLIIVRQVSSLLGAP